MSTFSVRKRALSEMLREAIRESNGRPIRIEGEDNETVGLFLPLNTGVKSPPRRTPEQEEELRRRLANIDDSIPHDEMVRLVMQDLEKSSPEL